MRQRIGILAATFVFSGSALAASPNGFAVWSEGSDYNRTLYKMELHQGVVPNLADMQKVCDKEPDGGDIQANISFDGRWVAFARSLPGTRDNCGGNDYHSFSKWDVYVVRVDGALPAMPIRVGHGYWPSWSDDSTGSTKTLYYSYYETKSIRKAVISDSAGVVSADAVHYNVPTNETDLHMMCSPDGQKVGLRDSGAVRICFVSNGQKVALANGCHPEWCSDSYWLMHARYNVGNCNGTLISNDMRAGGDDDGLGQYHYGCSNDMNWVITRVGGDDNNNQNDGYPIYYCTLDATTDTFTTHKEHKVGNQGNFPDIHVYTGAPPTPQATIVSFTASATTIAEGESVTLSWNTANTTSVTITGLDSVGESGSESALLLRMIAISLKPECQTPHSGRVSRTL